MNESGFNTAVCKKLLPMMSPLGKIWKIRDDYQTGVPDNFLMDRGKTMWVEFKYLKTLPKRPNTTLRINLSELQKQWHHSLKDNGQHAIVCLCVGMGSDASAVLLTPAQAINGITQQMFTNDCVKGYENIARYLREALFNGEI